MVQAQVTNINDTAAPTTAVKIFIDAIFLPVPDPLVGFTVVCGPVGVAAVL